MLLDSLLKSRNTQIDLVIPGLFDLPLYELDEQGLQDQTPALHRVLRYARRIDNRCFDIDEILVDTLGLSQKVLPYAHACKGSNAGYAVLFKPIHLKADINNALVFPVQESNDNISQLINDLQDFFKDDFTIHTLDDGLFLMHLHQVQAMLDIPHYLAAAGKKVTHYLEQAKSNLQWFKLFNEIQMFLFQHPLNQQRRQQGMPEINSLWCWGGDCWQGESFSQRTWFSDDVEMKALGRLYCADSCGLDEFAGSDHHQHAILVDLNILRSLKGDRDQDLMQLLMDIEQKYLSPLMHSTAHDLRIRAGASFDLQFSRSMAGKFWRKPVTLAQLSSLRSD